jgi:pimeloyl-ACP methyl ester carboxylesterase
MLAVCCVDPSRIPDDVVAEHVAMVAEHQGSAWGVSSTLAAARSSMALIAYPWLVHELILEIRAPTLIMHGTDDRLVPVSCFHRTVALRRDWAAREFSGVGHIPQLERPECFVDTVVDWLDRMGLRHAATDPVREPPCERIPSAHRGVFRDEPL